MSLMFSLNRFPQNGTLKDKSGLPWGCVVQPFATPEKAYLLSTSVNAEKVARCSECFAYINPFVKFVEGGWLCPLCQTVNQVTKRYATSTKRQELPELKLGALEFEVPGFEEEEERDEDKGEGLTPPVFIAVVDVTGSYDSLEAIKSGLQSTLHALPPMSLFGMVTFSDRIGIYDLQSSIPQVKHVIIPEVGSSCSLRLEEIVPLERFLVKISNCTDNISAAIDSLQSALHHDLAHTEQLRGFGTTISFLIDFMELFEENLTNIRVMTFLCAIPNFGEGALQIQTKSSEDILTPQSAFYKEQAERAAKCGAAVDIFVVTNTHVGLATIKFLAQTTGGNIMIYDQPEKASLPQDIYRQFSCPQASHALLRLRTSKEFRPSHAFGHFYPDPNYENLFHIEGCDQFKTFAFDFEFTDPHGFTDVEPPTIQMAFAYTYLPSINDTDRNTIRRRLRVITMQVGIARDRKQLYSDADPNVVLCLLTHKLIRASLDEGIEEGRLLLQDWLTILLTHYNEQLEHEGRKNERALVPLQHQHQQAAEIDLTFSKIPSLRKLSRYVFALLKSALLKTDSLDPDYIIYLQCLYGGLEPLHLQKALYPDLASYGAPNNLSSQGLPLSKASIIASGCKLFLVDAFTVLCVYLCTNDNTEEPVPFPPPKNSLIRKTINTLKADRHVTPQIIMARPGTPEEAVFFAMLIEEGGVDGQSYADFLSVITKEVALLSN